MNSRLRAILFDLDGTLLDSFPAHYKAYEVTLAHFGLKLTPQLFRETYTPDWFTMYKNLGIPEERYDEADRCWLDEVGKHRPELFPGTRTLLDMLASDYMLALVTSGSRDRVLRDLAAAEIDDLFQVIVTGDDVSKPKPDPQGLLIALEELDVEPEAALYVGDAREDCQLAHAAGVPFVGIAGEFATVTGEEGCVQLADLGYLEDFVNLE